MTTSAYAEVVNNHFNIFNILNKLKILTIIFLLTALAVLAAHSLDSINQDIGRHLKTGEVIWQTKSVPQTNLFSYTEPDRPFINHHWLSEVVFYWINRLVGLPGLIVLKVIILTAAFSLAVAAVYQRAKIWVLSPALLLGFLIFFDRSDIRPEIFSYLFLAFFLFAIFRAKYSGKFKYLYILPAVEIIWVNSHIYFIIGPALLFFLLLDQKVRRVEPPVFKKTLQIFLLTGLATLLNPNFIKGALAPLTILKNYGYTIVENQSIFFLTDYGILGRQIALFEISLVILIISFIVAFSQKRPVIFEFLAALFFTVLAIKMIRNFGLYGLAFGPLIALNFSTLKLPTWLRTKPAKVGIYLSGLALIWILIVSAVNNNFYQWYQSGKRFGLTIPAGAARGVEFIKANKIQGPVFNNFDVGSFLIWKLYPEQKVFVDGRPEAYSTDFFEKIYKPMQTDPAVWGKYSREYGINYVFFDHYDITPWARTFLARISQDPNWSKIYLDDSAVVFIKRTPGNKNLINRFEINTSH
ncbi:MAG: hypothetical protein AAB585_01450 [Patescibacteria group bacterium]